MKFSALEQIVLPTQMAEKGIRASRTSSMAQAGSRPGGRHEGAGRANRLLCVQRSLCLDHTQGYAQGRDSKKTVGKCFKTDGLNLPCAVKVQMNVKVRAAARVLPPDQRPRTLHSFKMYSCTRFIYKSRVCKLVRFSTFQQTFSGTRTECAPVQAACLPP